MAKKHYNWKEGPAQIDKHSLTKHEVLVEYLIRYFEQRTLNARGRDIFRVTLVDGFCGGGLYELSGVNGLILGSPFRMLHAVKEAQARINIGRTKLLILDVQYIFVDEDSAAISHLRYALIQRGYADCLGKSVHLICAKFQQSADEVIARVKTHTPRASKALFFLDQYGYSEVPAPLIKRLFTELDNSEVVLTFHVAAFATYTNDEFARKISDSLKIDIIGSLGGRSIEEIKRDDANWRRFIQSALYEALVTNCGAKYFTPFFIRGSGASHGEYWLVHLSQHHRAQDVMKQVHWSHHNHFIHYGGSGLNMLAPQTMGYMQEFDGGFKFDDVAREKSNSALIEQLASRIFERPQRSVDAFRGWKNAPQCSLHDG